MGRGGPQPNYQIWLGDHQVEATQVDIEDPEAFPFDENTGGLNVFLVSNDLVFNDDGEGDEERLGDPEDPEADLEENNGRGGCCGNCNNNAVIPEQKAYYPWWWMGLTYSEVYTADRINRFGQSEDALHSENPEDSFNNNNNDTLSYESAGEDKHKKCAVQRDHVVNLSSLTPDFEQLNMNQSMGGTLGTRPEKDSLDTPGEGRRPLSGEDKSNRQKEVETSAVGFPATFELPHKTVAPSNIRDAGLQVDLCEERCQVHKDPDVIATNCGLLKIIADRQSRVEESVWSDEISSADDPEHTTVSCFSSTLCNVDIVMVGAFPDGGNSRDLIVDIGEEHHKNVQLNQPVQQKDHFNLEYPTNSIRRKQEKQDATISNLEQNYLFRNIPVGVGCTPVDVGCTPSSEYDFGTYFLQHNCLEEFGLPHGNSLIAEIVRSKSECLIPSRGSDSLWQNTVAKNSAYVSLRTSWSECNSIASRNRKEIITKCVKVGLVSELGLSSHSVRPFNSAGLQDLCSGKYELTKILGQGQSIVSTIPLDCQLTYADEEKSTSYQMLSLAQHSTDHNLSAVQHIAQTSLESSDSLKTHNMSVPGLDLMYQRFKPECSNALTFFGANVVIQAERLHSDSNRLPLQTLPCKGINSSVRPEKISWSKSYLPNFCEDSIQFLDTFKPLSMKERKKTGNNVPLVSPQCDNTTNVRSASLQCDRTTNVRSASLQCDRTSLNTSMSLSDTNSCTRTDSEGKILKFHPGSLKQKSKNLTTNRTKLSPYSSNTSGLTSRNTGARRASIHLTTSMVDIQSISSQWDRRNMLSLPRSFKNTIRLGYSNTPESLTTNQLQGQTLLNISCTSSLSSLADVALHDRASRLIGITRDAGPLQELEFDDKFESESHYKENSDTTKSFVPASRDHCNPTTVLRDLNGDSRPDIAARRLSIISDLSQRQMPTLDFWCETQDFKGPETFRCHGLNETFLEQSASRNVECCDKTFLTSAQNLEHHLAEEADTITLTDNLSFSTRSGKGLHYNGDFTEENRDFFIENHYGVLEDTSSRTISRPDLSTLQEASSSVHTRDVNSGSMSKTLPVKSERSLEGKHGNSIYTKSPSCVSDSDTCCCPHCCRRRMMESSAEVTSDCSETKTVTNTQLNRLLSSTATSPGAVGTSCDKVVFNLIDCTHALISDERLRRPAVTSSVMSHLRALTDSATCHPTALTDIATCHPTALTDGATCHPTALTDSATCHPTAVKDSATCHPTALTDRATCHPTALTDSATCQPTDGTINIICQPTAGTDGNKYKPYLKSYPLDSTSGLNQSVWSNIVLVKSVSSGVQSDPSVVASLLDVSHCKTSPPDVSLGTKHSQDLSYRGLREHVDLNNLQCESKVQVNNTCKPNVLHSIARIDSRSHNGSVSKHIPGILSNDRRKNISINSAGNQAAGCIFTGTTPSKLKQINKESIHQISEEAKNKVESNTSVTIGGLVDGSDTASSSPQDCCPAEKMSRKRFVLPVICPRKSPYKKHSTFKLPRIEAERNQSVKKPSRVVALPEIGQSKVRPLQPDDLCLQPPVCMNLRPQVGLGPVITADVLLARFRESQREKIRQKRTKFIDKFLKGVHVSQNTKQTLARDTSLESKQTYGAGTGSDSQRLCSKQGPAKEFISGSQNEYYQKSEGKGLSSYSQSKLYPNGRDNDSFIDSQSHNLQASSQGASCCVASDLGLANNQRLSATTDFKPWSAKVSMYKRKRSILKSSLTKVPKENFPTSDKTLKASSSVHTSPLKKKVSPWKKNVTFEAQNSSSTGNTWAVQDDLGNQTAKENLQRTSKSSHSQIPRRSKSANVRFNEISSSHRIASDSSMGQCNTLEDVEALVMDATSTVSELPSSKTSLLSDAGEQWHQLSQGDNHRGQARTGKSGEADVLKHIMKCTDLYVQETNLMVYNARQINSRDSEKTNKDEEEPNQQKVSPIDSKETVEELAAEQTSGVEDTKEELSAVQNETSDSPRAVSPNNETYTIEPRVKARVATSSVETKLPNKSVTSVTESGTKAAGDKVKKKKSMLAHGSKDGNGGTTKGRGRNLSTCRFESNKPPRVMAESHYYHDSNTVNVVLKPINVAVEELKVKVQFCNTKCKQPDGSEEYRKTRFSEQFNKSLIHFSQSYNKQSEEVYQTFMQGSSDKDKSNCHNIIPF